MDRENKKTPVERSLKWNGFLNVVLANVAAAIGLTTHDTASIFPRLY